MQHNTRIALVYGLIAALGLVAFTTMLYLGGVNTFLSGTAYIGYLFIILIAVLATQRQKKLNGGYLDFREALRIAFTVLVLAMLAQSLFSYILFNFIDRDFRDALTQVNLEKTEQWLKKFGMPEDQVHKAIEEERSKDQYSPGRISLGFAVSCIFQFVIALIIAAVTKKKQPVV